MSDPSLLWAGPVESPRRYQVTIDAINRLLAPGDNGA
jgi:hypothetical protein